MKRFFMKKRVIAGVLALILLFLSNNFEMAVDAAGSKKVNTISTSKGMCVRGATLWPTLDTQMLDNNGEVICTIKPGTPVLALAEADNTFKIYYNKHMGYIDGTYVFINLPDVLQEEMLYDITNSYSSIYKIDGDDIACVTGEILYPYAKISDDKYLVPLLYPVAKQLYEAEAEAIARGYTLKVYDAYRPYSVTQYIYEQTAMFVEENPYYSEFINQTVNGVKYNQSFFLAKSASNHNYGVALDITICDLETNEELEMQSAMHELSPLSVLSLNTSGANLLQEIMTNHGFGTLVSEWWHFEIKDARNKVASFQVKPYK